MLTISTTEDLGAAIRRARKTLGLRQPDLAGAAGTSVRFISELERGKATAQIGRVLHVLRMLGLSIRLDGLPLAEQPT
jgi:y4mF family transcriptional regulator